MKEYFEINKDLIKNVSRKFKDRPPRSIQPNTAKATGSSKEDRSRASNSRERVQIGRNDNDEEEEEEEEEEVDEHEEDEGSEEHEEEEAIEPAFDPTSIETIKFAYQQAMKTKNSVKKYKN